jgi:uncharacterized membrane protein YhhN
MINHWPWYVILMAILNWVAVELKWKWVEYIAKPGTMILLLLWMGLNADLDGVLVWFILGGVLSMCGDIFLMLPGNLFIPGLVSFLLAHVAYIIGLNSNGLLFNWQSAIFLSGIAATSYWLYGRLTAAMNAKNQQSFKLPVLVYVLVISFMVYSALMTGWRDNWVQLPAVLVSLGAVLFYASDSMLAWDKFIQPLSHARLRVMVTYHLGQFGILGGALLMALAG